MRELVNIEGVEFAPIIYRGQRVVTFAQVDAFHERRKGTASRNFRSNRQYFKKGKHYWELTSDEIHRMSREGLLPARTARAIVLSQSGYLMVATSFTDARSWRVRSALVDYFEAGQNNTSVPVLSGQAAINHVADALQDPAFMAEALHQMIVKTQVLQEELAAVVHEVEFARRVQGSQGSMTISEAAKACGMKPLKFFAWLRDHHFLMPNNMPYQRHIDRGFFEARINVSNGKGAPFVCAQPLITGKGLAHVQQVMGCGQSLALELDANPSIPALPGGVS